MAVRDVDGRGQRRLPDHRPHAHDRGRDPTAHPDVLPGPTEGGRPPVRLALISDVHGNLEALESVIADIDERSPDAKLVCAGDVVGYGPDPEACIARLRSIGAPCVMGNHEEMVLGRRDFSRCAHAGITAALWTRQNLSPGARAFLDSLPPWLEVTTGVVVCHGTLDDADTYLSDRVWAYAPCRGLRPRSGLLADSFHDRAAVEPEHHPCREPGSRWAVARRKTARTLRRVRRPASNGCVP